ncbi:hypothetical protein PR003_g32456, partial [Phytophthora rubi]
MEAGKVDLMKKFGRLDIKRHDVFATAPDRTEFLRAYAFNENKSIQKKIHSGHLRKWRCVSTLCGWQVTLSKKRPTKGANTKLAFCPEGAWFVSDFELIHSPSCDAVRKCSSQLLMELPGFKSAMVKGLSTARARVAASVKTTDNVNVDDRHALVYGAISRAKKLMEDEEDNYDKLPAFLRSFARENPGSTVSCQLDRRGRFYRAFLSFGSLIAGQDNWVPLLECDGTHMKNAQYNGVCLLVIGKDGDWGNIPVAVAFVHKETAENFEWFFASCIMAGIKLHDRPLFSDRGKQRDAQVRLRVRGVPLNLKFCALHIFFNVCGHFRSIDPNIDSIRSLILSLQVATTFVEYNAVLTEINGRFDVVRTITVNGKQETQSVAQYLRKIHPSSWTKFGNDKLTPEETSAVKAEWGSVEAFGD